MLSSSPLLLRSAEDQVCDVLRDEIIHGLEPGTPLRLASIARRLGVSTMPVRTALYRLEREGLVQQEPRRGSRVAPLELDDLEEIQAARSGIEGLAARLGAERIDGAGLSRMREHLECIERAVGQHDVDEFLHFATAMEDECYRSARRPRLLRLVQDFRRAAQRYVRAALSDEPDFKVDFHYQLLDAATHRDGARAEAIIRAALIWTYDRIAARMHESTATAASALGAADPSSDPR